MKACKNGQTKVVQLLLECCNSEKSGLNTRDKYEWTPFMRACLYGHKEVVQLLLDTTEMNIDLNARNQLGQTAFMHACRNGLFVIFFSFIHSFIHLFIHSFIQSLLQKILSLTKFAFKSWPKWKILLKMSKVLGPNPTNWFRSIVKITSKAQCLKITEKVSFNISSEANYIYILSGQKLIKNAKNGQFGEFLKT